MTEVKTAKTFSPPTSKFRCDIHFTYIHIYNTIKPTLFVYQIADASKLIFINISIIASSHSINPESSATQPREAEISSDVSLYSLSYFSRNTCILCESVAVNSLRLGQSTYLQWLSFTCRQQTEFLSTHPIYKSHRKNQQDKAV